MDLYTPVQAVDFTDTGQWRLIVYISERGMTALLRHIEDVSQPLVQLFSAEWEADDSPLLSRVEAAVYDNPRLFEDYATEVIVETSRLTWVPDEFLYGEDAVEDAEQTIFSALFPTECEEVLSERVCGMTALFTLTRGLGAFLGRTLPGARIRSHIGVIAERVSRMTATTPRIFADIRKQQVDILAFDGKTLLSTTTQPWRAPSDVAYRIYHQADVLGITPDNLTVNLSGLEDVRGEVKETLMKHCHSVEDSEPAPTSGGTLPLAAAISADRS